MNCPLFICCIPTSSSTFTATMPGIKRVFPFGTPSHMPLLKSATPLWETAEPLRPACCLVALTTRPQAERSLGRGPSPGEFQNGFLDHESSSAKGWFISQLPLSQDLSKAGPGSPPRGSATALSYYVPAPNLSILPTVRSQPTSLYLMLH